MGRPRKITVKVKPFKCGRCKSARLVWYVLYVSHGKNFEFNKICSDCGELTVESVIINFKTEEEK